ncbi:hypothetical protein EDB89DRAFT_1907987 [Lactarius sanguifluus]|nr:hypothetical protein EDB89DRAFT_1907987 [Lactarius sanguifluus]
MSSSSAAGVSAAGWGALCRSPSSSSSSSSSSSQEHSRRSTCKKGGGKERLDGASSVGVAGEALCSPDRHSDNNLGDTPPRAFDNDDNDGYCNKGQSAAISPSVRTPDDSDDMGLAEGTPHRHWSHTLLTTATVTTRAAMEGIPLLAPHTLSDHGTTHHLPCAPSTMTTTVTHFTHAGSAHLRSPTVHTPYDNDNDNDEGDSDHRSDPIAKHT